MKTTITFKHSSLLLLMLLLSTFGFAQVFIPDGNYDQTEYQDAQILVVDPNANSTCEINTIYTVVETDDNGSYLLLGFNNGNGGRAIFRYYIDVMPDCNIGTDFNFNVGEADTVVEFDAKTGDLAVFMIEDCLTNNLVEQINPNIQGAVGDFNPGDDEFIEIKIPLEGSNNVIDTCELADDGNINLGSYIAFSGGSTNSNICSQETLDIEINLFDTLITTNDICLGNSSPALNIELTGPIANNLNILGWEVSTNYDPSDPNSTAAIWNPIPNTAGLEDYTPPLYTTAGTYYYRVIIENVLCNNASQYLSEIGTVNVIELSIIATPSDASCSSDSDGSITVQGSGAFNGFVSSYILKNSNNNIVGIISNPSNNPNAAGTFSNLPAGTYTIEFDQGINGSQLCQATTTVTVGLSDDEAPVITGGLTGPAVEGCDYSAAPAPQTTVAGIIAMQNALNPTEPITITDNTTAQADLIVTVEDTQSGGAGCVIDPLILIRKYTITDECGLSSFVLQTIVITDQTPPSIDTAASDSTEECDGSGNTTALNAWLASNGGAAASDTCSNVTWTNDYTALSDDCGATGSATVIFTATDTCGNSSTTTATFTVEDTTAPTIDTAASDSTVQCSVAKRNTALNAWLSNNGGAVASDACSDVTWTNDYTALSDDCGTTGSATVTFTATDDCGNTSTTSATFTIEDTTIPVIADAPAAISIQCADELPADTDLAWTDNCDDGGTVTSVTGPLVGGACGGTYTRTWNISDACGNVAETRTQIITLNDTTIPVIADAPAAISIQCADELPADTDLAWTDNCDAGGTVTSVTGPLVGGACGGTYTRTWNISDACGNVAETRTQIITLNDTTIPVIADAPAAISIQCADELPADTDLAWTDNCDAGGTVTSVTGPLVGGACGGTYTRTWNISDACGNVAETRTQIITLNDTTIPVIADAPAAISIQCADELPADTDLAWTDNCDAGGTVTSVTGPLVGGACGGTYTRTWNISDACGNVAETRTQIITLNDTTIPVIADAPAAISIQCADELPADTDLAWTDNCDAGGTVTSVTGPLVGGACGGTYTRTWNISDACGNVAETRTQIITLNDTTIPVIADAPAAISIQCADELPADTDLAWTDNCDAGGTVTSVTGPLVGGACGGTYTRTWNISDACGNVAETRTQIITLNDTTIPVIADAPAAISIQCADELPADTDLAWTDNCDAGGTVTSVTGPLVGGACGGTYTRTWNISDACGNVAETRTQIITLNDTTIPVIADAPAAISIQCADELPADTDLAWTDNCDAGGTVTSVTGPLVGGACGGTYTRTWNISDACGNVAETRTQIITLNDTTIPVIADAPAAISIQCADELPADTDLAWTDNCDAGGTVTSVTGPLVGGACGGTYTRTWNISDACGNVAETRTQIITLNDTTIPVIADAPAAISIQCADELPADTDLAWTDNCDAGGTVTSVTGPLVGGACGGTYTRTWNISDACGNVAETRTQIITLNDTTIPVIADAPAAISIQCADELPADTDLAWTDNCDAGGTVTSVTGPLVGGACGGTYTRTWNISDACGNVAETRTQIITLNDTTIPVIADAPAAISIQCADELPADTDLAWTDNCDAGGTVTSVTGPLVGGACGGTYTRTWNISDACGNVAETRTQIITLNDTTIPVIADAPAAISIQCADELPADTDLAWTDNCDAGGTVTSVTGPLVGGACGGTYTRTWNISDACGNVAETRTQIITLNDTTIPVIADAPAAISIQCADELPADTDLAWTDNCDAGGTVTSVTGPLVGGACGGTYTRTWNISDACGNVAETRTQIITLNDTTIPVIADAPAAISIQCADELPADTDLAWTDNCDAGGTVTSVTGPLVGGACGGTYTRTWNISDACGNVAETRTQIITLNDTTIPVIADAPAAISIQCADELPADTDLAWTDNCDAGGTVTSVTGPLVGGACGGTYTRTWNISDACGNVAETRTQIITLNDTTIPVIADAPAAISIQCADELPADTDLAWTDNCDAGGTVTSVTGPLVGGACGGTYTRTWNISDACGNVAETRTQIITLNDTTIPVIADAPAAISIQCADELPADTDLAWTDNCDAGGTVTSVTGPLVGGACGGTYTRTWNISDACGNVAETRTQIITLNDTTIPVIADAPAAISIQCADELPADTDLAWTDNCDAGGTVTSVTGPLVGGACGGTYTRTWNISDACGNVAETRTQIITLNDTTIPVIADAPAAISIQCADELPADTDLAWTDNCDAGGTVTSVTGPLVGGACGGTYTRTWNISDACGNVAETRTQIITLNDTTIPVIADAPAAISIQCADELPADTDLAWTDNCDAGGTVTSVTGPLVGGACGGTYTRTWNISDACGNVAETRTQIITLNDTTIPVIADAPAAISIQCADELPADTDLAWTDNCDAGGTVTSVTGPLVGGACGGTYTRTWNISDACGNVAETRTQIITLNDTTIPVIADAPAAISIQCADELPADTDLAWTDNCDAGGTVTSVTGPLVGGACGGTYTRTWNISDACGNVAETRTQIITLNDTTIPVIADAPAAISIQCADELPADTDLAWTDNCDAGGTVTSVTGPLVGGACGGTYTRTWNISDACGNVAETRTQIITLNDTTIPVIADAPAAISIQCADELPADTDLAWTDNCDAGGTVTSVTGPLVGGACGGTYTRTWNISDACGNVAETRTQIITLNDTTIPVIADAPAAISIQCADELPADTDLAWTDNCDAGGTVTSVTGPLVGGACGGTYTRTWNISDACGNVAETRTQIITLNDTTIPVIADAPAAISIQCADELPADTDLAWTDNCDAGGTVTSVTGPLVGGACGGTYTRTWNISDACGNVAETRTQIITLNDTTIPVIADAPAAISIQCADELPADTDLAWTDNCDAGGTVTSVTGPLVGGACGGTYTRTWNISDACGNVAETRTQIITLNDTTIPVIADAPAAISIQCADELPADTDLAWTDNCDAGGTVTSVTGPLVGGACGGTYTRTWNISDACGNVAETRTQIITLNDTTIPVIADAPAAISIQCADELPADTDLAWTDNCDAGGTVTSVTGPLVGGACGGTYTRTWNISDACGNVAETRTQIITLNDTTIPVIADAPAAISIQCADELPADTDLAWTDNCDAGGTVTSVTGPLVGGACGGTYTRTWNISDACGNVAETRTQIITLNDTTIPVIADAPAAISIQCADELPADTDLAWTDNCDAGGTVTSVTGPLVGGACGGTYTRTWNISDACGNVAETRTQIITLNDTTIPVIADAPAAISIQCADELPADTDLAWTDNCDAGGTVTSVTGPLVGGACGGTYTRTWNISDACGNVAETRTQIITLNDTTAPTIDTVASDITIQCGVSDPNALQDWLASNGGASATDNCSTVTWSNDFASQSIDVDCQNGAITITFTVTDECGNSISTSANYSIIDTIDPILTIPANVTVECDEDTSTTSTGIATASDDCSTPSVSFTDVVTAGNCPSNYIITRTWSTSDGCNTVTADQIITVQDTTSPVLSGQGADANVECPEDLVFTAPTASDTCSAASSEPTITFIDTTTSDNCGLVATTRTWTATDCAGNVSATVSQTLTYIDTTAPVLSGQGADANVECPEDLVFTAPTASDTCSAANSEPTITFVDTTTSNNCGLVATTRTWTATDECGNVSTTVSQTLTYVDTTAPVLSGQGADANVECPEDLVFTAPTASDTCSAASSEPTITFIDTTTSDNCGLVATTRTWTATDCAGNASATVSQTLTYIDTTAPVLSGQGADANVECPEDLVFTAPTASDTCSAANSEPTITFVDTETLSDCGLPIVTRTWTGTDCAGNVSDTVSQTFTYVDNTPPELVTPLDTTINVTCDAIPSVPSLEFTDTCAQDVTVEFVEISTQGSNNSDYVITRTWTVSDGCNEVTFIQIINVSLPNISSTDVDLCIGDDTDFDLFSTLNSDVDTSGIWTVTFGNATIDGSIFNPATVANNDGDNNPNTYNEEDLGDYIFTYTLNDDCSTEIDVTITLNGDCIVLSCGREDVNISNTVTANGDGVNEFFEVTGVETCGFVTEVQIFNRWGAVVYKNNNYQNDWSGQAIRSSVGNANKVPTGTYYYVITLRNSGLESFAGPIYMVTGN